jgi:hypothetical protein
MVMFCVRLIDGRGPLGEGTTCPDARGRGTALGSPCSTSSGRVKEGASTMLGMMVGGFARERRRRTIKSLWKLHRLSIDVLRRLT